MSGDKPAEVVVVTDGRDDADILCAYLLSSAEVEEFDATDRAGRIEFLAKRQASRVEASEFWLGYRGDAGTSEARAKLGL